MNTPFLALVIAAASPAQQTDAGKLREDKRLDARVEIVEINPPLGKVLQKLQQVSGVALTLDDQIANHDPKLRGFTFRNTPVCRTSRNPVNGVRVVMAFTKRAVNGGPQPLRGKALERAWDDGSTNIGLSPGLSHVRDFGRTIAGGCALELWDRGWSRYSQVLAGMVLLAATHGPINIMGPWPRHRVCPSEITRRGRTALLAFGTWEHTYDSA